MSFLIIQLDHLALVNRRCARNYGLVSTFQIKSASIADLADLYHVAIRTGNSGDDATGMFRNDDMIGEVYVGPYVTLAPETSFALVDNETAVGYGLCVLDTESFQAKARELWWPQLQEKYESLATVVDDEWLVREIFHPSSSPLSILEEFPSHGHIDLLPYVQGQGWGRQMMETMEGALRNLDSPGFHLRVSTHNARGLNFYAALGYHEIMRRNDEVIVGKRLIRE
jgi:ribosomal protein S18 acetylase RimI-like enzyme